MSLWHILNYFWYFIVLILIVNFQILLLHDNFHSTFFHVFCFNAFSCLFVSHPTNRIALHKSNMKGLYYLTVELIVIFKFTFFHLLKFSILRIPFFIWIFVILTEWNLFCQMFTDFDVIHYYWNCIFSTFCNTCIRSFVQLSHFPIFNNIIVTYFILI